LSGNTTTDNRGSQGTLGHRGVTAFPNSESRVGCSAGFIMESLGV
jgi:hypothetical protein